MDNINISNQSLIQFLEELVRFYYLLIMEGVVFIEIYFLLTKQLEVLDLSACQLTQQEHNLDDLGYAFLGLFDLVVVHLLRLQLLV